MDELMIVDREGGAPGIPKLRRLSLLEYLLGCMGASPSLSALHSCIFFHQFPSHTWKLTSYETNHKLIRVISTDDKIIHYLLEIMIFMKSYCLSWLQKVFAKEKQAQDLQNDENAKYGTICEKQNNMM